MTLKEGLVPFLSRSALVILTCTLLLVLSPLLVLLFTSLALIRHVLGLYKNIFHPELGPFLNGLDSMVTRTSPYIGEPVSNISYYMVLGGHITLSELRQVFQKGLDKMESEAKAKAKGGKGRLGGFRLKQYATEWAGFPLCADEPNFNIEDHVRMFDFSELSEQWEQLAPENADPLYYNMKILEAIHEQQEEGNSNSNSNSNSEITCRHWSEEELGQLAFELLSVPYKEKTSPWEALLLYNPPPSNNAPLKSESESKSKSKGTSIIMFRIHHSVTDASSLTTVLSNFLDQDQEFSYGKMLKSLDIDENEEKDSGFFTNPIGQIGKILRNVVDAPQFINEVFKSIDDNIWHPRSEAIRRSVSLRGYIMSFELGMDRIRNIKKRYKYSERGHLNGNPNPTDGTTPITTQAILLTATSLGIRDYMIQHAKIPRKNIPPFVHIQTGVAQQRPRNAITNQFVFVPVRIPVGSDSNSDPDPQTLMNVVQKEYLRMKNSSFARVASALFHLVGMLPTFVPIAPALFFTTGLITNNPVFENPVTIRGIPVIDVQALSAMPVSISFDMILFCYKDRIKVNALAHDNTFSSRREAKAFFKCIEKQLVHEL